MAEYTRYFPGIRTAMITLTSTPELRELPNGLKISHETEGYSLRLDSRGFWCSFRAAGQFYRRCMNGDVVAGRERPKPLTQLESESLLVDINAYLSACSRFTEHLSERTRFLLATASNYTVQDYERQQQLYQSCYPEPVTILPPDRYQDLVIQPAQGCPNNQCDFCAFYRDRRFRVLNDQQRAEHYQQLQHLFPENLAGRNGIFVGAANALAIPVKRFEAILEEINEQYPNPKRGICCFGDADHIPKRTAQDWQRLSERGLKQVVLGLETGLPELRKQLGKSDQLEKATALFQQMNHAGISTGLTVLVGANGQDRSKKHLHSTVQYLRSLKLSKRDIVYLSPLEDEQNSHKQDWLQEELSQFRESLKDLSCKVMPYQMSRFNYYS